jgi:hypothetical protein
MHLPVTPIRIESVARLQLEQLCSFVFFARRCLPELLTTIAMVNAEERLADLRKVVEELLVHLGEANGVVLTAYMRFSVS